MKKYLVIFIAITLLTAFIPVVSCAYDLPQKYSSDSFKTEIPDFTIPEAPAEQTGILTFLNKTLLPLETPAVKKGSSVYIPVEEFFLRAGLKVEMGSTVKISGDNVEAVFKKSGRKITVNGKEISLSGSFIRKNGVLMAPAGIAAEILNAKVWFDEFSDTLVISTGSFKNDNILRAINYKFWMNGEPYYEFSFNKWDLCYQINAKYTNDSGWPTENDQVAGAERALKLLHELGFRTIRVFAHSGLRGGIWNSEEQKAKYYDVMDTMFDLCDKYEIQIVVCMMLPSSDFCLNGEDYFDMICNRESDSRKRLYEFLDEYITRYKDRYSVLMWEIVNEGNLECDIGWEVKQNKYSLYQCGEFYADCAERIHMNDPERLVTGGDACLRPSQWHQYLGVKEGRIGVNWTTDTLEDRLKAYTMLYHGLDVVSVHCYATGYNSTSYRTSEEDDTMVPETFDLLMKEAKRIGKVLYNGETAVAADAMDLEEYYEPSEKFIQDIVDSGVQLNHWWTFSTDNTHHRSKPGWILTSGRLLESIMEGNKKLKEKYVVNGISEENTRNAWADDPDAVVNVTVTDISSTDLSKGCGASFSFGPAAVIALCILSSVVLIRKRKEI